MGKSCVWQYCLLLLAIAITVQAQRVRFHLNHPIHSSAGKRHELSRQQHRVRHDMRVFHTPASHLSHQAAFESYGLNDMGYYFTLSMTVGGLNYNLNIDTGSSDLFIKGENTPGSPSQKFTCPSCKDNGKKITIAYLDGALQTYKANLPVEIGPHTFNESLLVAYTAPHNFEASQGLVGLSFPQLARNSDPTFVQTLINNKIIKEYAFGVNLNFQQHQKSFINFGSPDKELFQGELSKYPLLRGFTYQVETSGISIGNAPFFYIASALLDTGNTCISIPSQFDNQILKQLNNDGNKCAFDNEQYAPMFSLLRCKVKDHDKLPSFNIHIGDDVYEIDHNVYMQRCISKPDGDLCDTYIESVKSQQSIFLGDGFFNRYYTYFDITNRQVGFAKNREELSYKHMYIDESQMDAEDKQFFDNL